MRHEIGEGHLPLAQGQRRHADANQKSEEGQPLAANSRSPYADLGPLVSQIRYWHRHRVYAMECRKSADLRLGSFLRLALGWSLSLPDGDKKRINTQAHTLIELGEAEAKGKPADIDEPAYQEWREVIIASIQARAPFDAIEKQAEKEVDKLARQLPVWPWWQANVFSSKATSLGIIVAEAGDLGGYANHSKLWKRMGVAVIDGLRQGGLSKSAPKDKWIEHGYNRQRRSRMWNIGDALIKADKGEWRRTYLHRKEYERKRAEGLGLTVAPAAKIPAKRQSEFMSDGHIHRRAQRYMEKKLLKHLWQVWHGQSAFS
jgi:hypothetical protein